MKSQKKKKIIIGIIIIGILLLTLYIYKIKTKSTTTTNSKTMAVYVEGDIDGEYVSYNSKKFPTDGYVLNTEKSYCVNGGVLSQDETTKSISVSVSKSDQCKLFFDKEIVDLTSDGILKHLGLTVKSGTPNFYATSPGGVTDTNFSGSQTSYSPTTSYYYTYASSYTFDKLSGTYTLVNPSVGKYSSIYSSLSGKYIVSLYGSSSSSTESYTNLSTIYQVQSSTTSSKLYYKTSTKTANLTDESEVGVWSMEDDYGTSYYFRGNVTNNYVKFAGFYWRIIRINGDGSIRMIYDGTSAHENGDESEDRVTSTYIKFGRSITNADIGYMYGQRGSYSYELVHANTYNSTLKVYLDGWYEDNLMNYSDYLSDEIFCNDRSLYSGNGYSTSSTSLYSAYGRLKIKTPTFKCPQLNDAFTVTDTINGNGSLTYPIGFITLDEAMTAGGNSNVKNQKYYLYKGYYFWTGSPEQFYLDDADGNSWVFTVGDYISSAKYYSGVAPVINLSAKTANSLVGTGVIGDEYRLPDNN